MRARVVAVRNVLARTVAGWWMSGAPDGCDAEGVIGDHERRPMSTSTHAPPRLVCPVASTVPSHGHSRCLCGKASRLGDTEERWERTGAGAVDSEWYARRLLLGWRQSTTGTEWGAGLLFG